MLPSQSQNKRVLENLTTAIFVLEPDLTVNYVNPAGEVLLNQSRKRILGQTFESLFTKLDAFFLEELKAIYDSKHSYTQRESSMTLNDGHVLVVDSTVTCQPFGKKLGILIEMQGRERVQRISREEASVSKHETAKVLVRGLAHEIKNPLGGIRGAAQLLSLELEDPELKEFTNVIIDESDRLRDLVDRILGSNKAPVFAPMNIHEILERVANLLLAESAGSLSVSRDYDPSIPEMLGDKGRLIQAVLNIARNAYQALQENEIQQPEIGMQTRILRQFTIRNQRHRLVARLDITDNGPGIAEDMINHIFYPLISGRAEGTGMGLSIAQSIVSQHSGLIECTSEPGSTTFSIYIPLETAA